MGSLCSSVLLLFFLFIYQLHFGHTKESAYSNASCIQTEWTALMEIKGSLIDKGNRLSSWTGRDCCVWHGITCDNITRHVQKLDLGNSLSHYVSNGFCLGGKINPSILNLEHLEYLDLRDNNFSGVPIPNFLGSLKSLLYLDLFGAGFSGEIPQHLGNLSNLQHLYLGDRSIGSYTLLSARSLKWVTGLSSLKTLDLSVTNLSESVDWLYSVNMLPSLSSLSLIDCGLVGAVSPFIYHVNLTSLVSLDLSFNNFNSTLPLWLFNLSSLEDLILLANSFISSLPDSFCNLTSLTYMDLGVNQLQGSLPLCLASMSSLRTIHLGSNELGGEIPSELGNLKQLTDLDLAYNNFKSSIPSTFGQIAELERIHLVGNQLNGTIPLSLGKLTKLRQLDVSHNSLTGVLSKSFFEKLRSLEFLSISNNQFIVFNVSSQWIPPFQIGVIGMNSVLIGTQFPPWLQTQRNVDQLYMRNVSIYGPMPGWCRSSFPKLVELDLSNNFFSGPIPVFDVNYTTSLSILNLANNHFSGNVPEELCSLRSLTLLSLGNNNLIGKIPLCLGNLEGLTILSLANNQLIGGIPLCLGNLRKLKVLDLANNSLSGHIPNELGNLENLLLLHLNGNTFFGFLPSSFQNLTLLQTLDLGENQLTGYIPEWIGKEFSSLQYLILQSNNFYGEISVNICQLSSLQILSLGQNNFIGRIPRCLGNLSNMLSDQSGRDTDFSFYTESIQNFIKGIKLEYSSNLKYSKFISLSRNCIQGEIPDELMDLKGLQSVDLSNNNLNGMIPKKIGNLKHLESLDLSRNQFYGSIPQSLANIDALSYLNLSFNNLAGHMPSGNHFDTLLTDPSVYEGNSGLCVHLISKSCPDDQPSKQNGPVSAKSIDDDNEFEFLWFYAGIGPGVSAGFLGVIFILYFKESWRHAYFELLGNVYNKVRVAFATKISNSQRRFN